MVQLQHYTIRHSQWQRKGGTIKACALHVCLCAFFTDKPREMCWKAAACGVWLSMWARVVLLTMTNWQSWKICENSLHIVSFKCLALACVIWPLEKSNTSSLKGKQTIHSNQKKNDQQLYQLTLLTSICKEGGQVHRQITRQITSQLIQVCICVCFTLIFSKIILTDLTLQYMFTANYGIYTSLNSQYKCKFHDINVTNGLTLPEQLEDDHVVLAQWFIGLAGTNYVTDKRWPISWPFKLQNLKQQMVRKSCSCTQKGTNWHIQMNWVQGSSCTSSKVHECSVAACIQITMCCHCLWTMP